MNDYNKSKNKLLIILIIKFKRYNNWHLYKWKINCYVYSNFYYLFKSRKMKRYTFFFFILVFNFSWDTLSSIEKEESDFRRLIDITKFLCWYNAFKKNYKSQNKNYIFIFLKKKRKGCKFIFLKYNFLFLRKHLLSSLSYPIFLHFVPVKFFFFQFSSWEIWIYSIVSMKFF